MSPLYKTVIFFLALSGTVYFFGKLITWAAYKIAPQNFEKEFTQKDISEATLVMFISIIEWSILFYAHC